ncbi:unnamed protein product [Adineta steineri]|uniref:Cytochrome P450 n=1 Tax=Adineta steineri TaxID=433720 RepID=A0A819KEX2_9BILA|nr:unnamed protein product [Adineta steineri]CAF3944171.1 unnamed protein product [Adineta steineri]
MKKYYFALFLEPLPCLPQRFFLGNILHLKNESLFSTLATCQKRFGDTYATYFGPSRFVCINNVEHVQEIFTKRHIYDRDSFIRSNIDAVLPKCLRTLLGDEWHLRKRIVVEPFRQTELPRYLPNLVYSWDLIIENWCIEKYVTDDSNKISSTTNRYMLELLMEIFMGNSTIPEVSFADFCDAFLKFNGYVDFMFTTFFLPTIVKKWRVKMTKDYRESEALLHSYIKKLSDNAVITEKNLINSFLEAHKKEHMSENDIFSDIIDILATAYATTKVSSAAIIYYLSTNPHIQTKIKEELTTIGINRDTTLTIELVNRLTYIECVCKEVIRHSTEITPFVARTALKDDIIGNDHNRINVRKDDLLIICTYNIHHDPKHWKLDPYQFLPERFIDEDPDRHRYGFLPFGGGHRACIAQQLAMLEMKVFVIRLMLLVTVHGSKDIPTSAINSVIRQEEIPDLTGVYLKPTDEEIS